MEDGREMSSFGPWSDYGIELRPDGADHVVSLFRRSVHGLEYGRADVWTCRLGSRNEAFIIRDAMLRLAHRWAVWGMLAPIIGDANTGLLIATEIERDAGSPLSSPHDTGEPGVPAAVDRRAPPPRIGAGIGIRVDLVLTPKAPSIVAYHDGRLFMAMRFDEVVDARRVWDWVRWQRHALASWHALFLRNGADAVERLILDGMLLQERAVGLPADPKLVRRPLRNWRPEGDGSRP